MNINLDSIFSFNFFSEKMLPKLTLQQKSVITVAAIAFGFLAYCLTARPYFKVKHLSRENEAKTHNDQTKVNGDKIIPFNNLAKICYFNPLSQTYDIKENDIPRQPGEISIVIELRNTENISADELATGIRLLGNFLAIKEVRNSSFDIQSRYCRNSICHSSFYGNHSPYPKDKSPCENHLNKEEIKECEELETQLNQEQWNFPIWTRMQGFHISREEKLNQINVMRDILARVREATKILPFITESVEKS